MIRRICFGLLAVLRMTSIVDGNGKLTIPLYHGTSDLFYASIMKFGLGGRNLIGELRVIEVLCDLFKVAETLSYDEDWLVGMKVTKLICEQRVTQGGLNFRHGSTYLTPSCYTAAALYATGKRFGSEALEQFMTVWERLVESGVELPRAIRDSAQRIIDFVKGPVVPILIRLEGVAETSLRAENGGDPTATLQQIGIVPHQANFELIEPIRVYGTEVFRILERPSGPESALCLGLYRLSV
jgi:hypothetical protein